MAIYIKAHDHYMYSTHFGDHSMGAILINCNELIVGEKYDQVNVVFTCFCVLNYTHYYIVKQ